MVRPCVGGYGTYEPSHTTNVLRALDRYGRVFGRVGGRVGGGVVQLGAMV